MESRRIRRKRRGPNLVQKTPEYATETENQRPGGTPNELQSTRPDVLYNKDRRMRKSSSLRTDEDEGLLSPRFFTLLESGSLVGYTIGNLSFLVSGRLFVFLPVPPISSLLVPSFCLIRVPG